MNYNSKQQHAEISELSVYRSILLLMVMMCTANISVAQVHWSGSNYSVVPSWFIDDLDPLADEAVQSQPDAQVNVYWNSSGQAIRLGNMNHGGGWISTWSVGATVGPVTVTAEFSKEIVYEIEVVQLEPGEAAIVITWYKKDYTGSVTRGMKVIAKIRQSDAGQTMQVVSTSGGGNQVGHNTSAQLYSTTGSGYWTTMEVFSQRGFMGSDGKYYVIGSYSTVLYWVPTGEGGGGGGELE